MKNLIVGELAYKRPGNYEDKKKALEVMYSKADWFAGKYIVLDSRTCKIVGGGLVGPGCVNKIMPVDDKLILDTDYGVKVYDSRFDVAYSCGKAGVIEAGKIYGYTYIVLRDNELILLNNEGSNVIPVKVLKKDDWMAGVGGFLLSVDYDICMMFELRANYDKNNTIRINENGTIELVKLYNDITDHFDIKVRRMFKLNESLYYLLDIQTESGVVQEIAEKFYVDDILNDFKLVIKGVCAEDKEKLLNGYEAMPKCVIGLMGREGLVLPLNGYEVMPKCAIGLVDRAGLVLPLNYHIEYIYKLTSNSFGVVVGESVVVVDKNLNIIVGPEVLRRNSTFTGDKTPVIMNASDSAATIYIDNTPVGKIVDKGHENPNLRTVFGNDYVSVQVLKNRPLIWSNDKKKAFNELIEGIEQNNQDRYLEIRKSLFGGVLNDNR